MLENINILKMASAMARHAANRHEQLSENIANADTPNYRAKDLEPFQDAYARLKNQQSGDTQGVLSMKDLKLIARLVDVPGTESPNGNNVSLEDQLMRTIETQQDHEAATLIYKKTTGILRMTLNGGA